MQDLNLLSIEGSARKNHLQLYKMVKKFKVRRVSGACVARRCACSRMRAERWPI